MVSFYNYYNKIIDSTGKIPKEEELKEIRTHKKISVWAKAKYEKELGVEQN